MRVVLIPGWNEGAKDMQVFVEGRHGIAGLQARGYACAVFDGGEGSLDDRARQLAEFISGLRACGAESAPVALFGYSAGGVLARAVVRKRTAGVPVAAIFQLAAPNAGIVTDDLAGILHRLHFSKSVIADLDIESDFMRELNGTTGHWERDETTGAKRWKLDRMPWVCRAGVPIVNLAGRVPHYGHRSDGVVLVESATLDGRIRTLFVDDRRANHLNLSGTWNPLTLVLRRWLWDDRLWPRAVEAAAQFFSKVPQN